MPDVTPYFLFLVAIYALGSLQFGYHIGELNTPQAVISCQSAGHGKLVGYRLSNCIRMDDVQYGSIVAMFPVGGLIGSLLTGGLADKYGRKRVSLANSILFVVGPLIMATANQIWVLGLGRIVCGIGSGVSMVSVPIYLNEISPVSIRGTVGVMTQLSCVVGILLAQLAGVYLSTPEHWRVILAIGSALGLLQFFLLWATEESPKWLASQSGQYAKAKSLLIKIRGRSDIESEMRLWKVEDEDEAGGDLESDERRGLLVSSSSHSYSDDKKRLSMLTFLRSPSHRSALRAIFITQLAQQFTGTNAVIFYSTSILASLLPDLSAWISVGISVVNFIVTCVAANLIDKTGRRVLLLVSLAGMTLSSLLLAVGINENIKVLSAVAATCIIASFALGLGPIPFLLISEYFDVESVGQAQSFGLSVNWIVTFCIGFFFPIMRQNIGGSSFYVFSSIALLSFFGVWRYVPESKDKTVEEVWRQ